MKTEIYNIIRKRCISDIAAENAAEEVELLIKERCTEKKANTIVVVGEGLNETLLGRMIEAVELKTGEKVQVVHAPLR